MQRISRFSITWPASANDVDMDLDISHRRGHIEECDATLQEFVDQGATVTFIETYAMKVSLIDRIRTFFAR